MTGGHVVVAGRQPAPLGCRSSPRTLPVRTFRPHAAAPHLPVALSRACGRLGGWDLSGQGHIRTTADQEVIRTPTTCHGWPAALPPAPRAGSPAPVTVGVKEPMTYLIRLRRHLVATLTIVTALSTFPA